MNGIEILKSMHNYNFEESIDLSISIKKSCVLTQSNVDIMFPHENGQRRDVLVLSNNKDIEKFCGESHVHFSDSVELTEDIIINKKIKFVIVTLDMEMHAKKIDKLLKKNKVAPSFRSKSNEKSLKEIIKKVKNLHKVKILNKNKVVNISIGRKSYEPTKIYSNLIEVIKSLTKKNIKMSFINNVTITTTMCPGIMLDMSDIKGCLTERGI